MSQVVEYKKLKLIGDRMDELGAKLFEVMKGYAEDINTCRAALLNYAMKDIDKEKILSQWVELGVWVPQSSIQDGVFDRAKINILDEKYDSILSGDTK